MYINLLHLPLFNFAYPFCLFVLSFPLNKFLKFRFHCFNHHLAPCFSFVFQFVLKLILFLTGRYNFLFPLFAESIYYTLFFLDCFHFAHGYMYMCIYHYFNHRLPYFVAATCLGLIFGFLFLDICFNLT